MLTRKTKKVNVSEDEEVGKEHWGVTESKEI